MKVGVIFYNFSPKHGGGYTFQDDIYKALQNKKTDHSICFIGNDPNVLQGSFVSKDHFEYISLIRTRNNRIKSRLAIYQKKYLPIQRLLKTKAINRNNWVKQRLFETKVDILWYVTPYTPVEIELLENELPYIYTVWDLQHRLQPWFPEVGADYPWYARERMYEKKITRAYAVITGNMTGKREIMQFYEIPGERVKILPHPTPGFALDADSDKRMDRLRKYGLKPGYLFYPAQFWPHKNHAVLLYALKCLKEKHILLDLVFVGQNKGNYSFIRRLSSKLGLDEQVHFCGFIPREDLIALYKNALCLTYPSFFGPENLPPLEAFALGCPVVASKVEGAKEQMGDAALLVEPNNEKAWAEAINKLLVEPELKEELIGAGKKRADEWRAVDFVDGIFDIIDECGSVRRCWGYNYQYLNT